MPHKVRLQHLLLAGLLAVALLALVRVPTTTLEQSEETGNAGELVGGGEIGQTFVSPRSRLSGVAFTMATYSNRENTRQVIFDLRARPVDQVALRTVRVNAREFKDHRPYIFRFAPLSDSRGHTYYASLRSPDSVPGNAVTVTYSDQNPYRTESSSSLYLMRKSPERLSSIARSVKLEADAAFTLVHDVPLGKFIAARLVGAGKYAMADPQRFATFGLLAFASVLTAIISLGWPRFPSKWRQYLLTTLSGSEETSLWRPHDRRAQWRGGVQSDRGPLRNFHEKIYQGYPREASAQRASRSVRQRDGSEYPCSSRLRIVGRCWRQPSWAVLLGALFALGLALRLVFAERLPYTNDEGTFLYDAWALSQGRLPGGDGVLKTPTTLAVLSGLFTVAHPTLFLGRLVSIGASLLTAIPLFGLVRRLTGDPAGARTAVALWLLTAVGALFGIYLHAQPLQILFGTLGLWLLVASFDLPRSRLSCLLFAGGAGALFAIALGARKTSAALVIPALVLALATTAPWRTRVQVLVGAVLGFGTTFAGLGLIEWLLYGAPGLKYFLGLDVAAIDPATTASSEERERALINGVLPLLREGLPLLALAAVALGGLGERLLRSLVRSAVVARLAWLLPLGAAWGARRFLVAHARPEHLSFGVEPWWIVCLAVLVICALAPRTSGVAARNLAVREKLLLLLVALGWLLGLTVLYGSWIKFTANYLAEFLPPLVILAVGGAVWVRETGRGRLLVPGALLLLLVWGGYSAARSGYAFEHTGTFDRSALEAAADFLRARVPKEEPILTAAVAIPALSGHRVVLDVAHPTHYAYGFIEPQVRDVYMAPVEKMTRVVLSDVRWVVLERLTAFSYFREYPEIERYVKERFVPVQVIENRSNPITILQRKEPSS